MSVEDVLTMGQRIRVEAINAAIRTASPGRCSPDDPTPILKVAKAYEDYIARETRLSEKPADEVN